jgi:hypothetical protein
MKYTLVLLALLSFSAHATDRGGSALIQNQQQYQGQAQNQDQGQNQTLNNDSGGGWERPIPEAPSAIAPSVSSSVICPMVVPQSKAFSVFLLSVSKTDGVALVPICVAHHMKQPLIVQALACQDENYKKAADLVGKACKFDEIPLQGE